MQGGCSWNSGVGRFVELPVSTVFLFGGSRHPCSISMDITVIYLVPHAPYLLRFLVCRALARARSPREHALSCVPAGTFCSTRHTFWFCFSSSCVRSATNSPKRSSPRRRKRFIPRSVSSSASSSSCLPTERSDFLLGTWASRYPSLVRGRRRASSPCLQRWC